MRVAETLAVNRVLRKAYPFLCHLVEKLLHARKER
jgi:hypothetical protein